MKTSTWIISHYLKGCIGNRNSKNNLSDTNDGRERRYFSYGRNTFFSCKVPFNGWHFCFTWSTYHWSFPLKSEKTMRRWFLPRFRNLWVPYNENMRKSCQDKCPGLLVDKCIAGSLPKDWNHIVVHKFSSGIDRGLSPLHQSRRVFWIYIAQYPGCGTGRQISVSDYPQ